MKSIEKAGGLIGQAKSMIHGTTVGENTLIQRSGPKIGLIATKGQRDRIEIQRCNLLWSFDFYYRKPIPLVPRILRKEVSERTEYDGNVLVPVDKEEVVQAARELVNDGHITAIAILFLNSYVNSRNEEEARK